MQEVIFLKANIDAVDHPKLPGGKVLRITVPNGVIYSLPMDAETVKAVVGMLSGGQIAVAHGPLPQVGSNHSGGRT